MTLHPLRSLLSSSVTQVCKLHMNRGLLVLWMAACTSWMGAIWQPGGRISYPRGSWAVKPPTCIQGGWKGRSLHRLLSPVLNPRDPNFCSLVAPVLSAALHSPDLLFKFLSSPPAAHKALLHSLLLLKSHITDQTRWFLFWFGFFPHICALICSRHYPRPFSFVLSSATEIALGSPVFYSPF